MTASSLTIGIRSGERTRTLAECEARVLRIAGGLARLGVSKGDCVAILMRNDIAFLEASYAAMQLGAYAVPINWHFKTEEIAYLLTDCEAKVLIAHSDLLRHVGVGIPSAMRVIVVEPPPEIVETYKISLSASPSPNALQFEDWLPGQPIYDGPQEPAPPSMIYTSGTTGNPKGVRRSPASVEQQQAQTALRVRTYGLKPGIRALLPGPLYHSAPNLFGLRAGRMAEALILMPRFDAEGLLYEIEHERIDTVLLVPTMMVRLLNLAEQTKRKYDLSSLRFAAHSAAPCPPNVKQAMIDWWGPVINEFYGSTEIGPVIAASSEDAIKKPGTIGKALPGARVCIADDSGILGPGKVGEIHAALDCLADFTYHRLDHKRAALDLNGMVATGDLGYVDTDGYYFICDRKIDMVISGGVNIYPAEIEGVGISLPGVHDCAVFGVPDENLGEALMAVFEPRSGVALDPRTLEAQLRERLADYKVPRRIEVRTKLPREDSGKIFKRRLRAQYWDSSGRLI